VYLNTLFRPNGAIGHDKSERAEALPPRPSPMSDVWYYANQGGHVGPFSFRQLKQTLSTMADSADVLVWCDKFPDWKRARDVPELWADCPAPSPSPIANMLLEVQGKSPFLRKPKWWLFILALPLLGSAANRIGREEMSRLSRDGQINREVNRWLSEGPPDIIISFARAIRANLLFVVVTASCIAYGIYDGVLLNSPLSGLIVGILSAGIVNLAMLTARKYRVKKPTPLFIWIGNIAYWLGWALASYGIFLMVYRFTHVGVSEGLKALGGLLPSVIFYPAVGWSIRYMLGAPPREAPTKD
jgi:GYF domain 2